MAVPFELNLGELELAREAALAVDLADRVVYDAGEADIVRVQYQQVAPEDVHRPDIRMISKDATFKAQVFDQR